MLCFSFKYVIVNAMPHFPAGAMPQEVRRLDDDEWRKVQESTAYACADVFLYDPANDAVFLADRIYEPQIGPWPIGGKAKYNSSPSVSAALHVRRDFGIELDPEIIYEVGQVSTPFPIAGPQEGFDAIGRHTINTVLFAKLKPEQVAAINEKVKSGDISAENSGGKWISIDEIRDPDSPYPNAVKEEMRMVREHEESVDRAHEQAIRENRIRVIGRLAHVGLFRSGYEKAHDKRIAQVRRELSSRSSPINNDRIPLVDGKRFALQDELINQSGVYAMDAVEWLVDAFTSMELGEANMAVLQDWTDLENQLAKMLYEPAVDGKQRKIGEFKWSKRYGDYHRRKRLAELKLPPVDAPDNGVKQRAVLSGAHLLLHAMNNGGAEGNWLLQVL
jgi:hypothetical protein